MEETINRLYVGGDRDYEKLQGRAGWSFLRTCKEGPGGHRSLLGYTTLGAPKGANYLWIRRGNVMALNLLDLDDPAYISEEMVKKGLEFIDERLNAGDKVLVACNAGHSRGPSMALMYMRRIGELPDGFRNGYRIFKTLYPKYDPGQGMLHFVKSHYNALKG
jgi:hypothetical protein